MKKLLTTLVILLFTGLVYQPGKGNNTTGKTNQFSMDLKRLQTGDIVLRNGKGFISEMFRKSSLSDRQFSHAGIIRVTHQGVFVVHVLGEQEKKSTNLRMEPIHEFCDSQKNLSYSVYRYSFLTGKYTAVDHYLRELLQQSILFDEQFDLGTDSKQYCTELIYKMCLNTAGFQLPLTQVKGHSYVGLDNLYKNKSTKLVSQQTY